MAMGWIKSVILKIVWPWLQKELWPALKEWLIAMIREALQKLVEAIIQWCGRRSEERRRTAEREAETATRAADGASSDTEADKWRAIADVWRRVADQFREDNQNLNSELERVREQTMAKTESLIEGSDMRLTDQTVEIGTGDTVVSLPAPGAGTVERVPPSAEKS